MPPGDTTMLILIEPDPQLLILDRGLCRRDQSTPPPGCEPFGHSIDHIATIRKDGGLGATANDLEGLNSRLQFHAVIGRCAGGSAIFLDGAIRHIDADAPAARPWIAQASTIGIGDRVFCGAAES